MVRLLLHDSILASKVWSLQGFPGRFRPLSLTCLWSFWVGPALEAMVANVRSGDRGAAPRPDGVQGQAQIPGLLTLRGGVTKLVSVSSDEIDQYLEDLEEPKRSTLQRLRQTILEVVPEAEQGISYQVPAFRARREGHRRIRCFQEPPELPSSQRFRISVASSRGRKLQDVQRSAPVPSRLTATEAPGRATHQGANRPGVP